MAKNKGICAICGKGAKLTFEHVPPRTAGNVDHATVYRIEEWLTRSAPVSRARLEARRALRAATTACQVRTDGVKETEHGRRVRWRLQA